MITTVNYRTAFIVALGLHLFLALCLIMDNHRQAFVVHEQTAANSMQVDSPIAQPIQAVSVDSQAVMQTLNRLKSERAEKEQAALQQQRALELQAHRAEQQRLREEQRLVQLKKEAAQLAITQQKKLAAEEHHLQELARIKTQQEQHLAALKQEQLDIKQQQERERLLQKANEARMQQEKARLAQQQARNQAAVSAQQSQQMAGEVNKYKALIVQAISQHWILPEHVNSQLSSQFRIRLAPNGAVLNVSLMRSSGDPVLDRSAQTAIYKASPLPVPKEQALFNLFRDISLTVRPESARG